MKTKKIFTIRRIIWTAVAITVIVLIVIPEKERAQEVSCGTVTLSEIAETVQANGKINPAVEVTLSPDISGEIVELYCREGDMVKKGDLLVKIRQDVYLSIAERAEAALNSANAQHSQQTARYMQTVHKYIRDSTLFAGGAISQSEMESSLAEKEIAKEQLKGTEYAIKSEMASLKEAEENIKKTMIYAPMSGVVSTLRAKLGERVVGTSQMAGTELLRIADFSKMELSVDINENDVVKISVGAPASISVDAYPAKTFTGQVKQIASSAKTGGAINGQVTNFEVKIDIDIESYADFKENRKFSLRPGMSASASIETSRKEKIPTVPLKSVTVKDGAEIVWVIDNNTVFSRHITTGIQDLDNIEVKSGLQIGETIVTSPWSAISRTLEDGNKVKIRESR